MPGAKAGEAEKPVSDQSTAPRDSRRAPIAHSIQLKFERFSGFINEYVANISPGGIFIRTETPEPQGQLLEFEFRLGDGYELIKGRGEVAWVRTGGEGPNRPAGMGIRFLALSPGSKELIHKIVDDFVLHGGQPFDVTSAPAPAAGPEKGAPPSAQAGAATTSGSAAAVPEPKATGAQMPGLSGPGTAAPTAGAAELDPLQAMAAALPPLEELVPALPAVLPPFEEIEPAPQAALPALEELEPAPPAALTPPAEPEPAPPPVAQPPLFAAFHPDTPRRRSRLPLAGVLLAAVVLGGATYLLRDYVLGWVTGGDEAEAARPHPITVPGARPAVGQLPRALALAQAEAAAASPASSQPAAASAVPRAAVASTPDAQAGTAIPTVAANGEDDAGAGSAAAGQALSGLDKITWESSGGGTDVVLWGNGNFPRGSYSHVRINGPAAREVIRLKGIERPFAMRRVEVKTPELFQVRTGFHPIQQLHVVLDLANPAVAIEAITAQGHQLRIHLKPR
ncbi:MAG TPA: TIGR02266 family protein [Thermoanaerobaculia bacterium]|nr:TIGR02266 family protein [Thermoanaerobaculia bacterium]